MRIQLTQDIPVSHTHGLTEGRELETIEKPEGMEGRRSLVWVEGDEGEPVGIRPHEYEELDDGGDA